MAIFKQIKNGQTTYVGLQDIDDSSGFVYGHFENVVADHESREYVEARMRCDYYDRLLALERRTETLLHLFDTDFSPDGIRDLILEITNAARSLRIDEPTLSLCGSAVSVEGLGRSTIDAGPKRIIGADDTQATRAELERRRRLAIVDHRSGGLLSKALDALKASGIAATDDVTQVVYEFVERVIPTTKPTWRIAFPSVIASLASTPAWAAAVRLVSSPPVEGKRDLLFYAGVSDTDFQVATSEGHALLDAFRRLVETPAERKENGRILRDAQRAIAAASKKFARSANAAKLLRRPMAKKRARTQKGKAA